MEILRYGDWNVSQEKGRTKSGDVGSTMVQYVHHLLRLGDRALGCVPVNMSPHYG